MGRIPALTVFGLLPRSEFAIHLRSQFPPSPDELLNWHGSIGLKLHPFPAKFAFVVGENEFCAASLPPNFWDVRTPCQNECCQR